MSTAVPPAGMPAVTLAKMMMDMPLPMPRWVMSSPSHITKAVPAVSVRQMNPPFHKVKLGIRSTFLVPSRPPPPLWNT